MLSQCIYAVYTRAFTESLHQFNDEFKQYLINTVHHWVHGVCLSFIVLVMLHDMHCLLSVHLNTMPMIMTTFKRIYVSLIAAW